MAASSRATSFARLPTIDVYRLFVLRTHLLDQLAALGYDTSPYRQFTENDVDILLHTDQSDMLVTHSASQRRVWVRYKLGQLLNKKRLSAHIDEAFAVLQADAPDAYHDTLLIIADRAINESLQHHLMAQYERDRHFVVVRAVPDLLFNLLTNRATPFFVRPVEPAEQSRVLAEHQTDTTTLPEISRFDPLAMALLLRPGQVLESRRGSPTALEVTEYSMCVHGCEGGLNATLL
eukprot:gene11418-12764_t